MSEKCILAASVALLACHPRTSINCFNSKQHTNPENQTSYAPNPHDVRDQNHSKSKKLRDHFDDESGSSTRSKLDIPSPLAVRAFKVSALNSISLLDQEHDLFDDVRNSFIQGWDSTLDPDIKNIFMINNGIEARAKFEEYREMVQFKAMKSKTKKKKLISDGNEILGFHSCIVTCSFGDNEVSRFCEKKSCGFCTVIDYKEEKKKIWFNDSSWSAHKKLTYEWAMNPVQGKKAIVMCRVIAGRIGRYEELGSVGERYGSAIRSVNQGLYVGEELMVLNPRAVLPSFIVMYEVK